MKFAYLLFAIIVILQPIGQILEKKGMGQIGEIGGFGPRARTGGIEAYHEGL